MLWEEMEKYTKLTGEDATHVPIMKIGAYLDGYDKGIEILDKIRAELHATAEMHEDGDYYLRDEWIDEYFNKYKAESEVDNGNDD